MTIQLSESREQFVRSLVAGGRFASVSEVVEEALGLLEERERSGVPPATTAPVAILSLGKPVWEVIREIAATMPEADWDALSADLAAEHDYYLYGTPRRADS